MVRVRSCVRLFGMKINRETIYYKWCDWNVFIWISKGVFSRGILCSSLCLWLLLHCWQKSSWNPFPHCLGRSCGLDPGFERTIARSESPPRSVGSRWWWLVKCREQGEGWRWWVTSFLGDFKVKLWSYWRNDNEGMILSGTAFHLYRN